ncbi:uncharacterized protein LOC129591324 isoform X2 [Paramacrobiotus metropolitanus]|uniref:uncharacterized protein LOC129591324 isoform X2 n=1 Tax=Paramacrobiotus metropolitanus TaxID=2943436 RepID=UPI002445F6B1|nr:uncharacterized protein LOC129591324 isoform X2 [Paramacrobiotus metropolitanus]
MQGKKPVLTNKMASSAVESPDTIKDLMAFVRFGPQNFVISLNPYDGWEQWQRVLSGLAPVPVEIVLLPPKAACAHDKGISIVDRRSYMEAMKVVETVRKSKEVLRFVLHAVKDDRNLELKKLVSTLSMGAKHEINKAVMDPASSSTSASTNASVAGSGTECPPWALEMKKELMDSLDQRFHEMLTSVDSKLSLFGSQMTESLISIASTSPPQAASQKSGSFDSGSIVALNGPDNSPNDSKEAIPRMVCGADVPKWISGLNNALSTPANSECGSVVVVTPPESFDLLGFDANPVNQEKVNAEKQQCEFEIMKTEDVEVNSETGSVVYVETDGEEEDDYANLRSWAGEGIITPKAFQEQDQQQENNSASMEQSFHSVAAEPIPLNDVQETIVYKPMYVAEPEETNRIQGESDVGDVPVTVEGVQQAVPSQDALPENLNAMQPLDEQNLFSPNSDLGTMLLSAASSIATGFMQSMETLSRTIRDYEQRRAQSEGQALLQEPVQQQQNLVASDNEVIPESVSEAVITPTAPPPVPPRVHRGPPPSIGVNVTPEEIMWYLQEYGIPDQIGAEWTREQMTHDTFSLRISEYFDRCG